MNPTAALTLTDKLAVFDLDRNRPTRRWLPRGTRIAVELVPGAEFARVTVEGESKTYRAVPRILIAATATEA